MNNRNLYQVIKGLREDGKTWEEVRKFLIKVGAINGSKVFAKDVQKRFQELAARVVVGELNLEIKDEYILACEAIDEAIGRVFAAKSIPIVNKIDNKVLAISDLHVPYVDHERMWKAVDKGVEEGCNILVINGDYLNADGLSTHAKFKYQSFEEELAFGVAILEQLREKFEIVYLLDDNHVHDRWRRWLGEKVPADRHFLMTHPYDYMVRGMDNVIRAGETHESYPEELSHFLILGDVMFSHAFVSGKDGESVRKVQSWYFKWKHTLNLDPVRVFAHGHVHSHTIQHEPDGAVIQIGCLASLEGLRYSMEGGLKYSPPVYGCLIFEQSEGVTDLNSIQLIRL